MSKPTILKLEVIKTGHASITFRNFLFWFYILREQTNCMCFISQSNLTGLDTEGIYTNFLFLNLIWKIKTIKLFEVGQSF